MFHIQTITTNASALLTVTNAHSILHALVVTNLPLLRRMVVEEWSSLLQKNEALQFKLTRDGYAAHRWTRNLNGITTSCSEWLSFLSSRRAFHLHVFTLCCNDTEI
ncbi:hypothetical protein SUGI_0898440 [Cryptomeria japonica]|nr:hypothetical protein SUGI_0898440 [Cryptomeria japonica]